MGITFFFILSDFLSAKHEAFYCVNIDFCKGIAYQLKIGTTIQKRHKMAISITDRKYVLEKMIFVA